MAVAASAAVAVATTVAGPGCTVMASKHRDTGVLADMLLISGSAAAGYGNDLGQEDEQCQFAGNCGDGASIASAIFLAGVVMLAFGGIAGGVAIRDEPWLGGQGEGARDGGARGGARDRAADGEELAAGTIAAAEQERCAAARKLLAKLATVDAGVHARTLAHPAVHACTGGPSPGAHAVPASMDGGPAARVTWARCRDASAHARGVGVRAIACRDAG